MWNKNVKDSFKEQIFYFVSGDCLKWQLYVWNLKRFHFFTVGTCAVDDENLNSIDVWNNLSEGHLFMSDKLSLIQMKCYGWQIRLLEKAKDVYADDKRSLVIAHLIRP